MRATSLLIWLIVILIIALIVGIEIQNDPGYAMIHVHDTVFETSFWFLLAAIIVIFIIVYIIIRLLIQLFNIGTNYSKWRDKINTRKALRLSNLGYINFACGDWRAAEKNFIAATKNHELRLSGYLLAARAAHAQNAFERRDDYLNKAYASDKSAHNAVLFTAAQLQITAGQYTEADDSLKQLSHRKLRSELALRLESKVAVETKDWQHLQAIIPQLRKQKILTEAKIEGLEEKVYIQQLQDSRSDIEQVQKLWSDFPRLWRQDTGLLNLYIEILLQHKKFDDAAPLLEAAINLNWDQRLLRLYGHLETKDPKRQLKQAEKWLKAHPKDDQLLLTLARLSFGLKLWGACKDYCEDSIALKPSAESYQLLGATLEELDQPDVAMECYRKGLQLDNPLQNFN